MKLCTFEGCGRKYSAKGYCKVHNNILSKEGVVRPIKACGAPIRLSPRLCSIEGCGRKHEAKGYCKGHWSQQHYKRPLSNLAIRNIQPEFCKVQHCAGIPHAHGLCYKHYARWRNTGTTDLLPKIHSARKECKHPGCETNKHNQGYCYHHYRELVLKIPIKSRGGHNKKEKQPCAIDGCEGFARAKGWCEKHYGRYRRNGDPLTCYRRPRKSEYVNVDNILKNRGTYSKADDEEVLRENFADIYNRYDADRAY